MTKFPQCMENVRIGSKVDIAGSVPIQSAVKEVEAELGDKGRVLLRPSGTEPLVRVMVEGEDAEQVARLTSRLAEVVTATLAA
jgi:phosphoglucosamine mutase